MPARGDRREQPSTSNTAIGKAYAMLHVLRRSNGAALTLTTLASEVGIAPSSAHSLLKELLAQALVVQDGEKRYRLGPALFHIGSGYARMAPIYRATWREIVALANEWAMTAAVAVPWDNHHLVLATHLGGSSDIEIAAGGRLPIDGGSWGKAYFAWSDAAIPKSLVAYTPDAITDVAVYKEEVDKARQSGYATDRGEFAAGVSAVATALTSQDGFEGVLSLSARTDHMEHITFDAVGRRLASLAGRASLTLGDPTRVSCLGAD